MRAIIKPLFIATSGGSGHLRTVEALLDHYERLHGEQLQLAQYARAQSSGKRFYVDILKDFITIGKMGSGWWNSCQRHDRQWLLKFFVRVQPIFDRLTNRAIKKGILKKLNEAHDQGQPYTEVVCVQPLNMPGITKALLIYNQQKRTNLTLKLYATDIFDEGCRIYLHALKILNKQQQELMHVYGVKSPNFSWPHYLKGIDFTMLDPQENPMVRYAFQHTADLEKLRQADCNIPYYHEKEKHLDIAINDKVASILLGGQGGQASLDYVKSLVKTFQHIIVFCGQNQTLKRELDSLNNHSSAQIHALGQQNDTVVARVLARTNHHITRCGGIATMELLAMAPLLKNQTLQIHNPNSGIPWEDTNGKLLALVFDL